MADVLVVDEALISRTSFLGSVEMIVVLSVVVVGPLVAVSCGIGGSTLVGITTVGVATVTITTVTVISVSAVLSSVSDLFPVTDGFAVSVTVSVSEPASLPVSVSLHSGTWGTVIVTSTSSST